MTETGKRKCRLAGIFLVIFFLSLGAAAHAASLAPDFLELARGTNVTFYGWGGDPQVNDWLDGTVAPLLQKEYGVAMRRVGMNIEDILNKLQGEKLAGEEKGTIDVVWINGENFAAARKQDLLFGPFASLLPNFKKYVDATSPSVTHDFGFPTEGYEVPYGSAQMVFFVDAQKTGTAPRTLHELLELAKKHPGKIGYAAPPDFTGSAFVRTVAGNLGGDKGDVEKFVRPALEYLKELAPYLTDGGKTYVASNAQILNMYADGEIFMGMSYTPFMAFRKKALGEFPASTHAFVLDGGTVSNTHFLAIPFNAPNKAGAAALIDLILSPELQASKMDPKGWGDLPVIDMSRLSPEEKALFSDLLTEEESAFLEDIARKRIPELPAAQIPVIEDLWLKSVPPQ